jgi:hypothetical protein
MFSPRWWPSVSPLALRGSGEGHHPLAGGHASITETFDRYGHLFPGTKDEAAALLDAYLELHARGVQS